MLSGILLTCTGKPLQVSLSLKQSWWSAQAWFSPDNPASGIVVRSLFGSKVPQRGWAMCRIYGGATRGSSSWEQYSDKKWIMGADTPRNPWQYLGGNSSGLSAWVIFSEYLTKGDSGRLENLGTPTTLKLMRLKHRWKLERYWAVASSKALRACGWSPSLLWWPPSSPTMGHWFMTLVGRTLTLQRHLHLNPQNLWIC